MHPGSASFAGFGRSAVTSRQRGAAPGFKKAPWVVNGASDLLVEIWGPERGKHARAALYQNELTEDAPIEIEMTVQVRP